MSRPFKAAVIKAAQTGDQRAGDRLVAESLPLVYNVVGRALPGRPSDADVDGVARETVRRVLSGLGGLRRPSGYRVWLLTVTMDQIRDHGQRHHTDDRYDGNDGHDRRDGHNSGSPRTDFVDLAIVRLGLSGQHREIAEATRWLDDEHRAPLSLWWLEISGELTQAEVEAALELSTRQWYTRLQQMDDQLHTARVVVRALSAGPRCALLDSVMGTWDGAPSGPWRERIAGHVYDCTVCSGLSTGLAPAEGLLAGLPLVPVATTFAPSTYAASDVASDAGSGAGSDLASDVGGVAARTSRPSRTEARDALRGGRRARRRRTVAVVAAVAALVAAGGAVQLVTGGQNEDETRASTTVEPEAVAPKSAGSSPAESASPSPSPSHSSASPTPSPKRSASKRPAATKSAPDPRPSTADPAPDRDPDTAPPPSGGDGGSFAQQVTTLVNSERAEGGCGPVSANAQLATAARRHSQDMAAKGYFDHNSPDGTDPGDRITAAGYRWTTYGENIARGQRTPEQVMEGWMNSPGHRANILNCAFKEIGVGIHDAPGGPWWTQAFGARS